MHYTCIACITVDSVMKMEKSYPQVCLEECKYKIKKMQMSGFINAELESNSESDSEAEQKSDTELMGKLESNSNSEQGILLLIIFIHTFSLTLNFVANGWTY